MSKIILSLPALRDALALVKPAVELRGFIPVLQNVRITAPEGATAATVSATDMEIAIDVPVERVEQSGAFDVLVPFKALADMLKASKASTATLERIGEETVAIDAGSARATLTIGEMNDYPAMNTPDFSHAFSLSLEQARDAFVAPLHAVSTEETRYYLNGICLDFADLSEPGMLTAVATDGHRLTRAVVAAVLPPTIATLGKLIVPRLTVGVIAKLLSGKKAPPTILVQVSGTRIQIVAGGISVLSKLVDGEFPDYHRVIPRDNAHISTVPAGDMAASLKRVGAVTTNRLAGVKLQFGKDFVTISARCGETGASAAETLNHGSVTSPAEPMEVGFNPRYLMDVMVRCGIRAEFALCEGQPGAPAVIFDPARRHVTHVVMPMRV